MQAQPNGGDAPDSVRWYVVRVAPQQEFKAASALRRRGFSSFVPTEDKWVRRSGHAQRHRRRMPLFVRYVFAGTSQLAQDWAGVRHDDHLFPKVIQGVLGLGDDAERTLTLTKAEVLYLASLSEETTPYVTSVNPHRGILAVKTGDKARVIDGPLSGLTGLVTKIRSRRALLDLFDSRRLIDMPVASLEAIG